MHRAFEYNWLIVLQHNSDVNGALRDLAQYKAKMESPRVKAWIGLASPQFGSNSCQSASEVRKSKTRVGGYAQLILFGADKLLIDALNICHAQPHGHPLFFVRDAEETA